MDTANFEMMTRPSMSVTLVTPVAVNKADRADKHHKGGRKKKRRGLILAGRQEVVLGLSPSVRYFEKPKAE